MDVQNIYYTTREYYQCHFDYNAFWAAATQGREVIHAFAYAIQRDSEKQRQFQNILRGIGFEVKLKPYIQRSDGSAKGDWDVGITLDIMEFAKDSDIIVLASGDGDYDLLVRKVRKDFNIPVEVYGVAELTAKSLIDSASKFVQIDDKLLLKS